MLTVWVKLGSRSGYVRLNGYTTLTPRSARAALEIAGYPSGTVWYIPNGNAGPDYENAYGYRVYPNSTRKLNDYR
jgi:hypothetical protein